MKSHTKKYTKSHTEKYMREGGSGHGNKGMEKGRHPQPGGEGHLGTTGAPSPGENFLTNLKNIITTILGDNMIDENEIRDIIYEAVYNATYDTLTKILPQIISSIGMNINPDGGRNKKKQDNKPRDPSRLRSIKFLEILDIVHKYGPIRFSEIKRRLDTDERILSTYLRRLINYGLLLKDGSIYSITDEGIKFLEERLGPQVEVIEAEKEKEEEEQNEIQNVSSDPLYEYDPNDRRYNKKHSLLMLSCFASRMNNEVNGKFKIDHKSGIPPIHQASMFLLRRELTEIEKEILSFLWVRITVTGKKQLVYDPDDESVMEVIDLTDDSVREALITLCGEGVLEMYLDKRKQLNIAFSKLIYDILRDGYDPNLWVKSDDEFLQKIFDIITNELRFELTDVDKNVIKVIYSYTIKRNRFYFIPPCDAYDIVDFFQEKIDMMNGGSKNNSKVRYYSFSDEEVLHSLKRLINNGIIFMPNNSVMNLPKLRISKHIIDRVVGDNGWGKREMASQ